MFDALIARIHHATRPASDYSPARLLAAAETLEDHNRWRRGELGALPTCPWSVGQAIDVAVDSLRKQAGRRPK